MRTRETELRDLERILALRPDLSELDPFSRTQTWELGGVRGLFPIRTDGLCACGCGEKLTGRRTRWASDQCGDDAWQRYSIHTGRSATVRRWLQVRDRGVCAECGEDGKGKFPWEWGWEADHILPVIEGGGGCGLEGYRTLCVDCHKAETRALSRRRFGDNSTRDLFPAEGP